MHPPTFVLPALPVHRLSSLAPLTSARPSRTHTTTYKPTDSVAIATPTRAVAAPPRPTETKTKTTAEPRTTATSPPSKLSTKATPTSIVQTADKTRPKLGSKNGAGGDDTGLPLIYDDDAVEAYWNARPTAAMARLSEVTLLIAPWVVRVFLDTKRGILEKTARARAAELRDLLTTLGPTFVKLGQALSVRPDLVGPEAMEELRYLCDAVPSFPNQVAFDMMAEELGRPVDAIYKEISDAPIAAASLGQVYKAVLRSNGREVAVKVQRPDMLRKVSLDLYCMKRVAIFASTVQNSFTAARTDYLSLLLQWAQGTYKELDYENEAQNSRRFATLVQARLPDVYVPAVYDEFTSRKVLTMEWIDGVKLADCAPEQINALVAKGVECFLFQLLSAGFFHADPHQGNLMRLENGQLCVIDFGLMAEVEKQEMDAMVSAIVHLANRDWPRVIEDFVALKFLPKDVDTSQVEPVIGAILDQALEGGGAKSINFQSLSDELAAVTFDFPFSIPPAFALLLRALSVLEGIALVGDPEFKLIMESFPFVSKLIMTDRSPALRDALRQVLYKGGKFSPTRLRVLVDSSQGIINEGEAFVDFDTLSKNSKVTREAVDFLFSKDGEMIREILVEEIAKGLDVLARDTYQQMTTSVERVIPAPLRSLYRTPIAPVVPLPFMFGPDRFFALPPVTEDERAYLDNVREIVDWMVTDGFIGDMKSLSVARKLMPEILKKSRVIGSQVLGQLGEKVIERFFNDLLRNGGQVVEGRRRVLLVDE